MRLEEAAGMLDKLDGFQRTAVDQRDAEHFMQLEGQFLIDRDGRHPMGQHRVCAGRSRGHGKVPDRRRAPGGGASRHIRLTTRSQLSADSRLPATAIGIERTGNRVADKYPNFAALAEHERSGIDYRVVVRRAEPAFAIMAPHGGGIEPGTSEIADAIAAGKHSFHTLEGLKAKRNADLHITSTYFDEPMCLTVLTHSGIVLTLHGEESEEDGEGVFLGGLDSAMGALIDEALTQAGFDVRVPPGPRSSGSCDGEPVQSGHLWQGRAA